MRRTFTRLAHTFRKSPKTTTVEEAIKVIQSGNNVFVQGMAATPTYLTTKMTEYGMKEKLDNINVYHMHTEGHCPYVEQEASKRFHCKTFFVSQNVRDAINDGRAEYLPTFMSDIPNLFRKNVIPLDVALVQASPPDAYGFCSLGTSVESSLSAIEKAKHVICQINKHVPRTGGDAIVHVSAMDQLVYHNAPLYTSKPKDPSPEDVEIGRLIATHLVKDGATIQLGIGNIPNMVLEQLTGHKNLGIHSEMFSDGVIPLIRSGVVNNTAKTLNAGKIVVSFLVGTQNLFDFVNENPIVEMRDVAYTNDPHIIRQHKDMTAINSAIEVDITGQVCSDSIGTRIYSGFGGQLDFIRGAGLADGGKAIIALHSRTSKGEPRIVPSIHDGGGIVTTRAHVNYVVTEYGIASLIGKTINERTTELIKIAHPDDRSMLSKSAMRRKLIQ